MMFTVIGGSGFIGAALTDRLVANGEEVFLRLAVRPNSSLGLGHVSTRRE